MWYKRYKNVCRTVTYKCSLILLLQETSSNFEPESVCSASLSHHFNALFREKYQTILVGGADEPIYLPKGYDGSIFSQIIFTYDYAASALHECAHWCVAGEARRLQVDYGYWYEPDGRSLTQQQEFERVEVKPQAIEWILSKACGRNFRVSVDNLEGECMASATFKENIFRQVEIYCAGVIPVRVRELALYFAHAYHQASPLQFQRYSREELER